MRAVSVCPENMEPVLWKKRQIVQGRKLIEACVAEMQTD